MRPSPPAGWSNSSGHWTPTAWAPWSRRSRARRRRTRRPAVADALLTDLPPAERGRAHDAVARALLDAGADPIVAATQLRAARAGTALAALAYRAAGDRLCFTDPAAAAGWYDDAAEAGAE